MSLRSGGLTLLACLLASSCVAFQTGAGVAGEIPKGERLTVGKQVLHVRTVGEGPDVLLVHGYASSLKVWDDVRDQICAGRRCTSLDLPGFGLSDKREGDYSPEALAEVLAAVMDARGITRTDVVAHSWGSSVALALALAHPKRVRRIVLTGAFVFSEQRPTSFEWAGAAGLGEGLFTTFYGGQTDETLAYSYHDPDRFVTQQLADAIDEASRRPGAVRAALAVVRGMGFERIEHRYKTVDKPALLVWGRQDRVSLPAYGRRLAGTLPRARLIEYDACGHFAMIEKAAAFGALVAGFLSKGSAP